METEIFACYENFDDFARVLMSYDNINTAKVWGENPGRHHFMKQLVQKAGLSGQVKILAPDKPQLFCAVRGTGIVIEQLDEASFQQVGDKFVGTIDVWQIDSNFQVTHSRKEYRY